VFGVHVIEGELQKGYFRNFIGRTRKQRGAKRNSLGPIISQIRSIYVHILFAYKPEPNTTFFKLV
jgi:hypothetical protein